jgi:DNA-directed RNA polymerase subunit alpha
MKEDTIEFLLNVKDIRLRALSDRPGRLFLDASGEGPIHAADIQVPPDYEIVNPDLYLATLDSPDARLRVEFTVEQGKGYQPATHTNGAPIGVIPVDAIFTPVRKVNYHVERTRVGQASNLDRLILEVWTDGTISGVEAISQAADILIRELDLFRQLTRPAAAIPERGLGSGVPLAPDRYNTPIEDLQLSMRAYNCLKRSGLMTVGQVLEKSEEELMGLRNFGRKSYEELRDKLIERGFLSPEQVPSLSRTAQSEGEEEEDVGPLGAALIEALREAGEDPSELIHQQETREE